MAKQAKRRISTNDPEETPDHGMVALCGGDVRPVNEGECEKFKKLADEMDGQLMKFGQMNRFWIVFSEMIDEADVAGASEIITDLEEPMRQIDETKQEGEANG